MPDRFPSDNPVLGLQDVIQPREVALTHPDLSSFIRLTDAGDIEIVGCDGLGIVLDRATRTVIINADQVKFLTQNHDGLRWNRLSFNDQATLFNQPTFLNVLDDDARHVYTGASNFFPTVTNV